MTGRVGAGFGSRLRALRLRRGLAQKDLAGPGVSMSYVSRLESGDRVPTSAVVLRLAQALQVEPAELLGGTGGSPFQEKALTWCEAVLAYRDGDVAKGTELLGRLAVGDEDDLLAWCARWTRTALIAKHHDPESLLKATEELCESWSPGPAVDAHSEIFRTQALRRLGYPAEAVRAARLAVELASKQDVAGADRTRTRALVSLCTELARSGRLGEAEHVVSELGMAQVDAVGDRLAVTAWWVRAQVEDRLGEHEAAERSIGNALTLLGRFESDASFRISVRLAAVSMALRSPEPDLAELSATLDVVEAEGTSRHTELAAQTQALRAEVALLQGAAERCWELAERALTSGELDEDDQLRCRLLKVRAAHQADNAARSVAARADLASLLDRIGTDVVDPVMWRDVARFALSATVRPTL